MLPRPHHIFFDLDRTLWDFETNSRAALHELYVELKVAEKLSVSFDAFMEVYYRINDGFWQQYRDGALRKDDFRFERFAVSFRHFGFELPELAQQLGQAYIDRSPIRKALIPGAVELLNRLQAQSVPISVITNGFDEVQHLKMRSSGIVHYFEHIITSESVGALKPNRLIFDHALQLAGIDPHQALMVGDHWEADIEGALNAGWHAVYLDPIRVAPVQHERLRHIKHLNALTPLWGHEV